MISTWMIKDLERQRRERERRDPPQLRIELPVPARDERPTRPAPSSPVVIEFGDAEVLGA